MTLSASVLTATLEQDVKVALKIISAIQKNQQAVVLLVTVATIPTYHGQEIVTHTLDVVFNVSMILTDQIVSTVSPVSLEMH